VVLAGGLATRLGALARSTPKYLVPVAGRPFAEWQLGLLRAAGYEEVLLCVGHLGEAIAGFVGDGARFGLSIRLSHEGQERLGTAGALRRALDEGALAESFLLTYGDSYLPGDLAAPLRELEARPGYPALMSVLRHPGPLGAGNVALDPTGRQVTRYEKGQPDPALDAIDHGSLALRRSLVATFPPGPLDLSVPLGQLARDGQLAALVVTERFYEIGSPSGLAELDARLTGPGIG
jgi:NDP-sugar pyrophosphorylase family protein